MDIASAAYAGSAEINGDSSGSCKMPDGRIAVVLSDGMGKGRSAARESRLAVDAIMKMLEAGLEAELSLKMLNLILMLDGNREIYTTMDLMILDPVNEMLKIYKIGAAPTLIKRAAGSVEILTAPAMPLGVMEYVSIPYVSAAVASGDQVIMMTDGIVDSVRGDLNMTWLRQLLAEITSRNPQTIGDLILRAASINYGACEKDDMTAVVMRYDGAAD